MDNFEHEIDCPDNKAIKSYLWSDYFHDSEIFEVSFDGMKKTVTFLLECHRDMNETYEKFKCNDDVYNTYVEENKSRFIYALIFRNVKFYRAECFEASNCYINGRFKDTALLRKIQADSEKPLYHFRIQYADGYAEVLFSDLRIRKKAGRLTYPAGSGSWITSGSFSLDYIDDAQKTNSQVSLPEFKKLCESGCSDIAALARANLLLDDTNMDTCVYAAYLLGKEGDISDIPKLTDMYLNIEKFLMDHTGCMSNAILPKRIILDAMELICYRSTCV